MMNLMITVSLLATSLVATALFSPKPPNEDQVIVKGGHRAVVVEYGDDIRDGNTKVSISSEQPAKGSIDEQLSRAAASVAGVAQDVKGTAQEALIGQNGPHGARPRELICDAYGKCKHKISDVWSKAKEKAGEAEEVVEEVVGKVKRVASTAGQKAEEVVKEKTGEIVEETGEKIKEGKRGLFDFARRGKEVVFDGFWYVCSSGYSMVKGVLSTMMNVMDLLGFSIAYGSSIWVTFIMSHVLARVLPRQQFGMVQSKIYLVYFKVMVGSIGLALLGLLFGKRGQVFRNKADMLQGYNLLSSLLLALGNLLVLEPRATRVMFNRMKLEKEEGRGRDHVTAPTRLMNTVIADSGGPIPTTTETTATATATATATSVGRSEDETKTKLARLDGRLKKLNSYSSLVNIMTLMGLTWHLVYLSQRLRANC